MFRRLLVVIALIAAPARAEGPDPSVYDRFVYLITSLYVHVDEVTPQDLLFSASDELADQLDWLVVTRAPSVGTAPAVVRLAHGLHGPIGTLTVETWADLPSRLGELEALVRGARHPLGDVNVRDTVLLGASKALDRYSRVLTGQKLEDFDTQLTGTMVGIGATLGQDADRLVVRSLVDDGPAARGGLLVGDVVRRIDGVSTVGMTTDEAVRRVRGGLGTMVTLDVLRPHGASTSDDEELVLTLTRANIVLSNVTSRLLDGRVAYLAIDHVSQKTVYNLRKELAALTAELGAPPRGLVLDLRGNTGGSMKESAGVVDQFVSQGLLLATAGRDGLPVENLTARITARDSDDEPAVPLAVLVDARTASGAEIISGGLVEHGRAAVIGQRTFGKGQVQKVYDLDPDTRLKLTVAEYVLANERHVTGAGIRPDVTVGEIELGGYGARFGAGWDLDRESTTWDAVVPNVDENKGWRGRNTEHHDLARELARRAVLTARAPTRQAVLDALVGVTAELRREQETHLAEALSGRGIDWSPASTPGALDHATPEVSVTLDVRTDEAAPERRIVRVTVRNDGPTPLHRTLVRIACASFDPWDDLVVPVGMVAPGATATGEASLMVGRAVSPREDLVSAELRADGRPVVAADEHVVAVSTGTAPSLTVRAGLAREAGTDTGKVVLDIRESEGRALTGVDASFRWLGDVGVELLDRRRVVASLPAGGSATLDFGVRLTGVVPDTLPVGLAMEADGWPNLLDWTLPVPVDGTVVELTAPTIDDPGRATSGPVGPYVLPLWIQDDRRLTSVVVFAGGHKVLYDPGGVSRLVLRAPMTLDAGPNKILVRAEDDQGLVRERYLVVLGLGGEGVSAGE